MTHEYCAYCARRIVFDAEVQVWRHVGTRSRFCSSTVARPEYLPTTD